MNTKEKITELEIEIEKMKEQKFAAVKAQQWEEAVKFRYLERELTEELQELQNL